MSVTALRIDAACRQLKMPGMARAWQELLRDAEATGVPTDRLLAELLEVELNNRRENAYRERLRDARFPAPKTLDTYDFTAQPSVNKSLVLALAKGGHIHEGMNVCLAGDTGTGKTHLAIALGIAAIGEGFRVRFVPAVNLVSELLAAAGENQLPRAIRAWRRFGLLICDDLGYIPLSREGAQCLFQLVADRYEHGRSLLVTTNLPYARWTEVLGDAQMTVALLDRFTHRIHTVEFTGQSYRFRESLKRQRDSS